jgi:hypothetical protein
VIFSLVLLVFTDIIAEDVDVHLLEELFLFSGWGSNGNGVSSGTEWQVSTPHSQPVTDKSLLPFSPDGVDLIKVVLLGAPGVGKTSIVQVSEFSLYENSRMNTFKKVNKLFSEHYSTYCHATYFHGLCCQIVFTSHATFIRASCFYFLPSYTQN